MSVPRPGPPSPYTTNTKQACRVCPHAFLSTTLAGTSFSQCTTIPHRNGARSALAAAKSSLIRYGGVGALVLGCDICIPSAAPPVVTQFPIPPPPTCLLPSFSRSWPHIPPLLRRPPPPPCSPPPSSLHSPVGLSQPGCARRPLPRCRFIPPPNCRTSHLTAWGHSWPTIRPATRSGFTDWPRCV